MSAMDEQILRTSKEIIVKFIEVGRVSPTSFAENFAVIYEAVSNAVRGESHGRAQAPHAPEPEGGGKKT